MPSRASAGLVPLLLFCSCTGLKASLCDAGYFKATNGGCGECLKGTYQSSDTYAGTSCTACELGKKGREAGTSAFDVANGNAPCMAHIVMATRTRPASPPATVDNSDAKLAGRKRERKVDRFISEHNLTGATADAVRKLATDLTEEAHHTHHTPLNTFYQVPSLRQNWGDVQEEAKSKGTC